MARVKFTTAKDYLALIATLLMAVAFVATVCFVATVVFDEVRSIESPTERGLAYVAVAILIHSWHGSRRAGASD